MYKIIEGVRTRKASERVADKYLKSANSDKESLRWALKEIQETLGKLDDVNVTLAARDPGEGEGYGSLADDNGEVRKALQEIHDAAGKLDKASKLLRGALNTLSRP